MQESQDCFGRYYESTASECRICLDNVKCRHAMRGKKIRLSEEVNKTKEQDSMPSVKIAPETIENALKELNVAFEKKESGKKAIFRLSSDKHKKYADVCSSPRGVKIYSKFAIEGAKVDEKDSRPYSIVIDSEEKFFEILANIIAKSAE